jgi:hypothetical protein
MGCVAASRRASRPPVLEPARLFCLQTAPNVYIPAPLIISCQVGHGVLVNLHLQRTRHVHEEFTNQASPCPGVVWYVNSARALDKHQG